MTTKQRETAKQQPLIAAGHYPSKGRQPAVESNTTASLCARQTPELFGGVSTD